MTSVTAVNPPGQAAERRADADLPLIKIYGERNTGTIYFSELMRLNFSVRELRGIVPWPVMGLQLILPGREAVRDAWFSTTFGRNLGWKHMRVKPVEELKQYSISSRRLHFATITKNPYSWLLSMHRRPYHQYYSAPLSFEAFLTTPWQTTGRDQADGAVENPIQLWNLKNRSYLQLEHGFSALNLKYEDVLGDPDGILKQVEGEFQLQRRSGLLRNVDQSTKDRDKDSDFYRDYYLNERWREKLSPTAIRIINEHLDHSLMQVFGYSLLSPDRQN